MAEVTIKAVQRVAGLVPGTVVTVERTEHIEKLIKHGRVEVLSGPEAGDNPDRLPGRSASKSEWEIYAETHGVTLTSDMTKADIIEAVTNPQDDGSGEVEPSGDAG